MSRRRDVSVEGRRRALSDSCLSGIDEMEAHADRDVTDCCHNCATSCASDRTTVSSYTCSDSEGLVEISASWSDEDLDSLCPSTPTHTQLAACLPDTIGTIEAPPGMWQCQAEATTISSAPLIFTTRRGTRRLPDIVQENPRCGYVGASCMRTTLLLRNLEVHVDRSRIVDVLDKCGFQGCYNFIYLPTNFKRGGIALGYAIVNFVSNGNAVRALEHSGSGRIEINGRMVICEWSSSIQGFEALIQRYRNNNIMHPSVPATFRPLLIEKGAQVAFPEPTVNLKTPPHLECVTGRQTP